MDAITLLKQDHKTVKGLFSQFEKTSDGARRQEIVAEIIRELTVHAEIEEEVFYPAARQEVPDVEDDVLESYEEHRVAVWMMEQLEGLSPDDERYEARVMVFKEIVEHHVEEEEEQWFPKVREDLGRKELGALGAALEEAKARRGMTVTAPAKRPSAKKSAAKRPAAKKAAPAKKTAAKKASATKRSTAKKSVPAKKAAAKKR
jgi:hemerythrin superfamily protein